MFANNSQINPRLQSGNPSTFPLGWNVDASSGLTIMEIGVDLNGTEFVCLAVGADKEVSSEPVILTVGG